MSLKKLITCLSLGYLSSQPVFAAPHIDEKLQFTQPNGSVIELIVNGNEHFATVKTLDGALAIYDKDKNAYYYAEIAADNKSLLSTGIIIDANSKQTFSNFSRNIEQKHLSKEARDAITLKNYQLLNPKPIQPDSVGYNLRGASLQSAADSDSKFKQVSGNVLGLTLLVDFPDVSGTISQQAVEDYTNKVGYTDYNNAHSIRDYWSTVSGDKLDFQNVVTEYYTAAHPLSYYTDPSVAYGVRARELINEALTDLDRQGFNFSRLTTDSFGTISALSMFYAGSRTNAWAQGLWPHKGSLVPNFSADGVTAKNYQITDMTNELSVGTFIHEIGHLLLGWPDLYDKGQDSRGIGTYGVMGSGSGFRKRPTPPNPWLRHDAGWTEVTELNTDFDAEAPNGKITLAANSHSAYRWTNPANVHESFYIEARTKTDQDLYLPDQGLLIWHIDANKYSNNEQDMTPEHHYMVSVVQADGQHDLENKLNYGDSQDLFDASSYDEFSPNTLANSNWWNGDESGLTLTNISDIGGVMTFNKKSTTFFGAPQEALRGQAVYGELEVSEATKSLSFSIANGEYASGDADIYVRHGATPTMQEYDCRPWKTGSNETCTIDNPQAGVYYIMVYAYNSYTDVIPTYSCIDCQITYPQCEPDTNRTTADIALQGDHTLSTGLVYQDKLKLTNVSNIGYQLSTCGSQFGSVTLSGNRRPLDFQYTHFEEDIEYLLEQVEGRSADIDNIQFILDTGREVVRKTFQIQLPSSVEDTCAAGEAEQNSGLLTNNDAVCVGTSSAPSFYFLVPEGIQEIIISTAHGTGNADLYYRAETWANTTEYDLKSTLAGNKETIVVRNPAHGYQYIKLDGDYAGLSVKVEFK